MLLDVPGRIARLLIDLAVEAGSDTIEKPLTHQTIAQMIGASRETVSRVFQLLQGRGIVERQGNDLRVDNAGLLREMAAGQQTAE